LSGGEIDNIILKCELVNSSGDIVASGVGARSVTKEKGDLNKALKMAKKSALIDATLDLGGLSEVFTQDIEDMAFPGNDNPELVWSLETRSTPFHFGKNKGVEWKDLEFSFLGWLKEQANDNWVKVFASAEMEHRDKKAVEKQALQDEQNVNNATATPTKKFPDDYSRIDCVNVINGKLAHKYTEVFGKGQYQAKYRQGLGNDGLTSHSKDMLVSFINDLGDEIRMELKNRS